MGGNYSQRQKSDSSGSYVGFQEPRYVFVQDPERSQKNHRGDRQTLK